MNPTRRTLLLGAVGLAGAAALGPTVIRALRAYDQPRARVATLRAAYDAALADVLFRGLSEYPEVVARARAGRVVLKPNLVEYSSERPINTDARLLAATIDAFRRAGAREVVVAEGPGHRRDTEGLVEHTGLGPLLAERGARFVDLNVDATREMALARNYTGLGALRIGRTVLDAALVVSVAKLKTHHWAGATLTMKNLFGVVPGSVYGWPKNPLHWGGVEQSIVDLWDNVRPGFGIIDGVVGMEGDGPIMGTAVPMGVVLMGDNLPAVDATAARLMGLVPERFSYLRAASRLGGTVADVRVERTGDDIDPRAFQVLDHLGHLRA